MTAFRATLIRLRIAALALVVLASASATLILIHGASNALVDMTLNVSVVADTAAAALVALLIALVYASKATFFVAGIIGDDLKRLRDHKRLPIARVI